MSDAAALNTVLVVNSGSSSLKFALYPRSTGDEPPQALARGQVDGLQPGGTLQLRLPGQAAQALAPAGADGNR